MKFSALFPVIGTSLPSTVSAWNCRTNSVLTTAGVVYYHSERACRGYDGNSGSFQGTYGPGERKSTCISQTGGFILRMHVENHQNNKRDYNDNECWGAFEQLLEACAQAPCGPTDCIFPGGGGDVG